MISLNSSAPAKTTHHRFEPSNYVHYDRFVFEYDCPYTDFVFNAMLCSDVHLDSYSCAIDKFRRDAGFVKKIGGYVMSFGDLFDLMQGHHDKRRSRMREEINQAVADGKSYSTAVAEFGAKLLYDEGLGDSLIFSSLGNHETAYSKHSNTDIMDMVSDKLRLMNKGKTFALGGYGGYVELMFKFRKEVHTYRIKYFHGAGGNSPRSKGTLKIDIQQKQYEQADLFVRGHDHHRYIVPQSSTYISPIAKQVKQRLVLHGDCGTYKRMDGWADEKEFDSPVTGGLLLTLQLEQSQGKRHLEPTLQLM